MNTNEIFVVLTGAEGGKQYIQLNDISAIGVDSDNIEIIEVDVFSKSEFSYTVKETPEEVMAIMQQYWNIIAGQNKQRG